MSSTTYAHQARRIGEQLRERRRALRLTQAELAELAGTTQRTVSVIENGQPTTRLATLTAIAEALGLQLVAVDHSRGETEQARP